MNEENVCLILQGRECLYKFFVSVKQSLTAQNWNTVLCCFISAKHTVTQTFWKTKMQSYSI